MEEKLVDIHEPPALKTISCVGSFRHFLAQDERGFSRRSSRTSKLQQKKLCADLELEISLPSHQQSHDSPFCAACETAIARAAKLYIHVIYPSYFQTTHRPYKFPISSFAFIKAAFRRFCTIDIFHGDVMTRQQQILAAH